MKERTLQWDGKCDQCRKLMSKCMCFQERADRLAGLPELEIKADQRPLYNALRKMHHSSPSFLVQPPPAGDVRRDRTKSHDLPPRHYPSRQRDPRARLLSTSATGLSTAPLKPTASMATSKPRMQTPRAQAGVPVAGRPSTCRPSSAGGSNQRSSSQSSGADPAAAKRSSIYASAPKTAAAYPYSSFDASSLAPAGESFDSADSIYEL